MKIIYRVNDKEFDSEEKALAYENELFEETKRKKKMEQEKQAQLDNIQQLYDSLMDKINDFSKKYPNEDIRIKSNSDASDFLFDLFSLF